MIILLLPILVLLLGFGTIFAFTAKVLIVGVILGILTLVALALFMQNIFKDKD